MKNVLVAVDFSEVTTEVMDTAKTMAKAFGSKLWLLHATETEMDLTSIMEDASPEGVFAGYDYTTMRYPFYDVNAVDRDRVAKELKKEHEVLSIMASDLKKEEINATAVIATGPAADVIISKAEKFKAELIVIGSHGHSLARRALLGSVSESVLKRWKKPLLIVPVKKVE